VRLRAEGLQPRSRRAYRGVDAAGTGELQRHVGDADGLEEDRGTRVPGRGLLRPAPAGAAAPPDGVLELLRQAGEVSALQVAEEVPEVGGVHHQRVPVPGREADPGEDGGT